MENEIQFIRNFPVSHNVVAFSNAVKCISRQVRWLKNLCSEGKRDDLLAICMAKASSQPRKAPGAGRSQQAPSFPSNPISLLGQPLGWDWASFKAIDLIPAEEGALVESLNHLQCVRALRSSSLAKWSQLSPRGGTEQGAAQRGPRPSPTGGRANSCVPPCDVLFFISGPSLHLFPII